MLKAYKYRLYPNLEQREYLVKTFGCTRFIYNKMLADKNKSMQNTEYLNNISNLQKGAENEFKGKNEE